MKSHNLPVGSWSWLLIQKTIFFIRITGRGPMDDLGPPSISSIPKGHPGHPKGPRLGGVT